MILNEIQKDNLLSGNDIENILKKNYIFVTKRTVTNRLNEFNYSYKIPKNVPLLTEKSKIDRLEWAKRHINFDWKAIIFSDESQISKGSSGIRRWVSSTYEDTEKIVKHPLKRNMWGCITYEGLTSLNIFSGIMDSKKYIDILEKNLIPIYFSNTKYIFQSDNDPKHTSKMTIEWSLYYDIKRLEWPSYSPDLNPMENLWGLLKNKVSKRRIESTTEFEEYVRYCWQNIPKSYIVNLYNSMPIRIKKVIEMEGDIIDY